MYTFADLKRNKGLRDAYTAYLKRKGWEGIYNFAMKKQTAKAEMRYLLKDISSSENVILGKAGDLARTISVDVDAKITAENPNAPPKTVGPEAA